MEIRHHVATTPSLNGRSSGPISTPGQALPPVGKAPLLLGIWEGAAEIDSKDWTLWVTTELGKQNQVWLNSTSWPWSFKLLWDHSFWGISISSVLHLAQDHLHCWTNSTWFCPGGDILALWFENLAYTTVRLSLEKYTTVFISIDFFLYNYCLEKHHL